jgi:serine/threonine-protein kinase RsbW
MMVIPDHIEITLPCKAEYVSVARLTTSGIASRCGFDIETIEDTKVAVSEVCNRIINVAASAGEQYTISFDIYSDRLAVTFTSGSDNFKCIFNDDEDGFGMAIINAFMDNVEFCPQNDKYILAMTKYFEVGAGNGIQK